MQSARLDLDCADSSPVASGGPFQSKIALGPPFPLVQVLSWFLCVDFQIYEQKPFLELHFKIAVSLKS